MNKRVSWKFFRVHNDGMARMNLIRAGNPQSKTALRAAHQYCLAPAQVMEPLEKINAAQRNAMILRTAEYICFLGIAAGSAGELETQPLLAGRLAYHQKNSAMGHSRCMLKCKKCWINSFEASRLRSALSHDLAFPLSLDHFVPRVGERSELNSSDCDGMSLTLTFNCVPLCN